MNPAFGWWPAECRESGQAKTPTGRYPLQILKPASGNYQWHKLEDAALIFDSEAENEIGQEGPDMAKVRELEELFTGMNKD